MKRLILIFSLILLLTACGKEKLPLPPMTDVGGAMVDSPIEETVDPPTVEVETTLIQTEEAPAEESGVPASYTCETVEGLVEDTVGYTFEIPTFDVAGAEAIRTYYHELAAHLESYTKETVYTEAASRACIVSVYGYVTQATLDGDVLTVTYVFECDYSDAEEPVTNTRTDSFLAASGEVIDN